MIARPPPSYDWTLHPGLTDYGAVYTPVALYTDAEQIVQHNLRVSITCCRARAYISLGAARSYDIYHTFGSRARPSRLHLGAEKYYEIYHAVGPEARCVFYGGRCVFFAIGI